jgi:hypothetical protein
MDAGYGINSELRAEITALGLTYVAGILSNTTVWAPGSEPLPPKKWSGQGRRPKLLRRDAKHQPISVKELALALSERAWRTVKWQEGSAGVPSPCHVMYRSVRLPDLGTLFHRVGLDACGIRQLQTQRLCPCGLNVTSRTRLQQCEDDCWSLLSRDCRDAHAAPLQ